ncbi:MAG: TorF family putative porin, partial [Campylobacterota bacterium]|nr:TorF family putative porin [Campylobacterota bacterium]
MKLIKLSLVTTLLASSLLASQTANEAISVSGDVTFTSNSLWRGGSGTNNSATVQGTLGIEHESGVYAGMWGTGMSTGTEIDLYAGYAKEISGLGIDAGFVTYTTTGVDGTNEDFKHTFDGSGELYLGASYDVGVELGAMVYVEVLDSDSDSMLVDLTVDKSFGSFYAGAIYGLQMDEDSGNSYYSVTLGNSFESINGDLSLNYQQS